MSSNVLEQHKVEHHKIGIDWPGGYFNSADAPIVASGQKLTLNIDPVDFGVVSGVLHFVGTSGGGACHDPVTVLDTASVDLTLIGQQISADVLPAGVDHALLNNLNSANYTHLTAADALDLTDGKGTTLHTHCHADLDCLQSNDHTLYYLSVADPIVASGQMITLNIEPTDFSLVGGILTINDYGIHHGNLLGLTGDDHTQYLKVSTANNLYYTGAQENTIHATLSMNTHTHQHHEFSGLLDDDHTQYLNTTRGDARYYTEAEENDIHSTLSMQGHTHDHGTLSGLTDNDHSIYATGVGGVPLTYAAQAITFNYGAGDFVTSGNDLRVINKTIIHSQTGNLLADDHTQYIRVEGRSGGQLLFGGTAATDFLILSSTRNSTKYYIVFGTAIPWMVYDEVNCRLGIGVTTPSEKLHLGNAAGDCYADIDSKAGSNAGINLRDGTIEYYRIKKGAANYFLITNSVTTNTAFSINPSNDNVILCQTAGWVGIGVVPAYELDVYDNSVSYVANFFSDGNDKAYGGLRIQAGADANGAGICRYLSCWDGNGATEVGSLQHKADGTFAVVDPSDERLKDDIKDTYIEALSLLKKIKISEFRYKNNPNVVKAGFIAQDLLPLIPEAISESEDGILGISRDTLIPYLVKAVQEQQEIIEQLQADMQILQNKPSKS